MGSTSIDARDFGYVADADPSSAGINATALNDASKAASAEFGTGFDSGGGGGARVELPRGTAYVGDTVVLHDGVEFLGHGTYGTVLKMPSSFDPSRHFIRWGTQGSNTAVCALQTLGAAGGLAINGELAVSGTATFIQKRIPAIYSAGNNSGVNFTITGTDYYGSPSVVTIAGPTGGASPFRELPSYFKTISSVVTDRATVGAVSVGMQTVASFGSRLTGIQLWSNNQNATAGAAMVFSDNAQHTGLKNLKIFGGTRICASIDKGIGGASWIDFDEIETFNSGNQGVNNPQFLINYSGLLVRANKIVCGGPGNIVGGGSARAITLTGGHLKLSTFHPESVYTGLFASFAGANYGSLTVHHAIGHVQTPRMFQIDSNVGLNNVLLSDVVAGGSTTIMQHDPSGVTVSGTNVIKDRWF